MKPVDRNQGRLPTEVRVHDEDKPRKVRNLNEMLGDPPAGLMPRSASLREATRAEKVNSGAGRSDRESCLRLSVADTPAVPGSDGEDSTGPGANMSHEEARTWLCNRLEDDALIDHVLATMEEISKASESVRRRHAIALRNFTKALVQKDRNDSLRAFLARLAGANARQNSSGLNQEPDARSQLDAYERSLQGKDAYRQREAKLLASMLEFLLESCPEQWNTSRRQPAAGMLPLPDSLRLRALLPTHERELIESVEARGNTFPDLVIFSSKLLLEGHGGLSGWLAMYKEGHEDLARRLLAENLSQPGNGALAAIERLQKAAGIVPDPRVRTQRTSRYLKDFHLGPEAVDEPGPTAGEPASRLQPAPAFTPTMTPTESVQWFQRRKDDARLIDAVYTLHASGTEYQIRMGSRLLRGFMKALLKSDSNISLKDFLGRFNSDDGEEGRKARDQASAFASTLPRATGMLKILLAALDEVSALASRQMNVADDEFSVIGTSGTPTHDVLPPDDVALISLLGGHDGRACAARNFAVALLEMGIGGLSEWVSMRYDGRIDQARRLLDEFMASDLTERVRNYIAGTVNRLLAAVEGRRQFEHAGGTGASERTHADEGRDGGREGMLEFAPIPRRPRTARNVDPALRGRWNLNALAPQREVTMSHEEACRWHRNRLEDNVLIDHVLIAALKALGVGPTRRHFAVRGLRNFARALTDADKGDSLSAFLSRTQDLQGDKEQEENKELATFLLGFDDTSHDRQESNGLVSALEILRHIPIEERNAAPVSNGSSLAELSDPIKLRRSLPPHELALMAKVEIHGTCPPLVGFSSSLLLNGYGGLTEWLAMHKDGRVELARKLLIDKFERSPRGLAALSALQEVSGIEPGLRIRIKGTKTYVADLGIEMQVGSETGSEPRDRASAQACNERVMTREEAVQWFQNRKDDAILIDSVYLKRCGGDRKPGATLLRRFTKTMLDNDSTATLRDFLRRFNSNDPDVRQMAEDEVRDFGDNERSRRRLEDALNVLVKHGYDDVDPGTDELDLFNRFGTAPRWLLPPDDEALVALLADDEPIHAKPNEKKYLSYTGAATRFAIALLERGIGGLSEWLAMQGDDASSQDKAEAKVLLESFLPTLPPGSGARGKILVALRRLQTLTNVDSAYTIKRNHPRAAEFGPLARPHKRQRGEASSAGGTRRSPSAEDGTVAWDFELAEVPRRPRTARIVVDQPQHAMDTGDALPADGMEDASSAVKQEPSGAVEAVQAPIYVEAEMLDQGRTAFYREIELCDLSGDMAEWCLHLNPKDGAVVRHRPDPIPENDDKFPLRDPEDPLHKVHRRYAGPDGNCDEKVRIRDVKLGNGFRSYFRDFVKTDGRLRVDSRELPALFERLEKDALQELDRLIRETSRPPRCEPRVLQKADVLPHEEMLVGQYGLFVRKPSDGSELPTFSNGRILGFYMGALVDNDKALERTVADHPDYELYAIDADAPRGKVTYSGKGATNSLAFANTALKPDTGEPTYDKERINALFIEFSAGLLDNQGKPSRENLVAMVALDNLFTDDRDEAQVFVDYGPLFLEHFKEESAVVETSEPVRVKPESESGQGGQPLEAMSE